MASLTEEQRVRLGDVHRGTHWSDRQRQMFVAAMKGHEVTTETRAKISANHRAKGIRPSAEAIAKGNASRKGKPTKGGRATFGGRPAVYAPEHPLAMKAGYVYEHILVAERHAGRPIMRGEVVHHIDLDPLNNDPANLMILPSQSDHMKLHAELRRYTKTAPLDS